MPSLDQERVRVRELLLQAASARLFDAVTTCTKTLPMSEVAAFVEGDESQVDAVAAGPRRDIAALLCERFPKVEIVELSKGVMKYEPGFLPCVFVVRLSKEDTDVSVVALRMSVVN
ncbi:MAG TPA: hypothetical protein VGI39_36850 [Polyangiaceae bacterium]